MFGVTGMVRHGTRRIYTHVTGYIHSVIHSGLDNGLNLSESTQNSKPILFKLVHHTQATHHPAKFEPLHYQDTYTASGVWKAIFVHQHRNQFSMTTFTSQV